ncbi:16S rRNA (cytosine(967)-C(5))-methyltransferase RsmB [Enterococcus timonensis]|uniref:16S rRNA (cytosine(967)-C(5))-methyltransferase RsmB n=1 Tax=Enterococcus timonensis TaxID=1852364 RepID=UPI0008DA01DF|nr:16S rRNA (cytosine(967)-C(5))-methyltransferase RsmB [Enterococcus timonensis]
MKKVPEGFKRNPRFLAMAAIEQSHNGGYSNLLVKQTIKKNKLSPEDGRLFTEIVYGTIMYSLYLDYQLAPYLEKQKKILPWVNVLLKSALYQMIFLSRVPDHAILNESVDIAKKYGHTGLGKLINGVLRNVQRNGKRNLDEITDPLERLSIEASFPLPLLTFLDQQLGFEKTSALAKSLLTPSRVSARVDLSEISRKYAQQQLTKEGIETEFSRLSPAGLVGEKGFLAGSSLFEQGLITIQDETSMLVAPILDVHEDAQVLDACAAPGGKTTHIASFLTTGRVTAIDIHQHKVKLIEENAERLHVTEKIWAEIGDARLAHKQFQKNSFDRILVDAPCSGLGLMRRKPDIKYQKNPQDFLRLPEIQLEILESCAQVLKLEGIMVYSTCTINILENEEVVQEFLKRHPEFILEQIKTDFAGTVDTLTIYPQDFGTDGFFISRLKKIA